MEFDPFSEAYFDGAWDAYRWIRDEAPAYYNDRQDFWTLSRYDDVKQALKDTKTFISGRGVLLDQLHDPNFSTSEMMPGFLITEDAPKHNRLRRLTSASFTPRGVTTLTDRVKKSITKLLDPLEASGSFDFVKDFAALFPGHVIFNMFGVPEADHRQLLIWVREWLNADDAEQAGLTNQRREENMAKLFDYFRALAADRRRTPRDDMISTLVTEKYVEDGVEHALSDVEVGWYAMMVCSAGSGTTTLLAAEALVQLHRHRDQWRKIVADPSLIPQALEEVLRYDNAVHYIGRKSTVDVIYHGQAIPAGSNFLMLIACANRDERAFENPDVFDIERRSANAPISFGAGPHVCIGAHLARLEAKIVMEEVVARWPNYTIDESGLERTKEVAANGYSAVPFRAS